MYSFLYLEPVISCLVLTVASSPTYRSLRKKVRWSGIPISWWIFNSIFVIHKIKAFSVVNKAEVDAFFLNSLAFSIIQRMLAIWSLVPLPFLNPAWTSVSSQFTYCWSLAWKMLSITLLACERNAIVQQLEHSLALSSLGLEWKLTFSSPRLLLSFQICQHIITPYLNKFRYFTAP